MPRSKVMSTRASAAAAATTSGAAAPVRPRRRWCPSWPDLAKRTCGRDRQVLVKLELHGACGSGSSSSCASAAPQAAAARTPATVTTGYSAMISSVVIPAARQSRMTLTGTRVPTSAAYP